MGGTIDKVYFDDLSDYTVGEPQIGAILAGSNVDFDYEVVEVARKDSLYVTDAEREVLRAHIAADPRHCVLVTHGTDTMEMTIARLLFQFASGVAVRAVADEPSRCVFRDPGC